MKQMTRREFELLAKQNDWEVYTQRQVYQFSQDILKSEDPQEREWGAIDYVSLSRVEVTNEDLTKSILFYREQQVEWDKAEDGTSMKARSGIYKDTPANRKKGIVGMRYGQVKKQEEMKEGRNKKSPSESFDEDMKRRSQENKKIKQSVKNGTYPGLKEAKAEALKQGYSEDEVNRVIKENLSVIGTEDDDMTIFGGKEVTVKDLVRDIETGRQQQKKKEAEKQAKADAKSNREKFDKENPAKASAKISKEMRKYADKKVGSNDDPAMSLYEDESSVVYKKSRDKDYGSLWLRGKNEGGNTVSMSIEYDQDQGKYYSTKGNHKRDAKRTYFDSVPEAIKALQGSK